MRYTFFKRASALMCEPIVISLFLFVILLIPSAGKQTHVHTNIKVKKIVSLSPSITRQIIDLGKEELLVGVTAYHPPLNKKKAIIGTLISPDIEKIVSLKPDVIVSSKEDNSVQHTEIFERVNIRVHYFDRNDSFESICGNYIQLGQLLNVPERAESNIRNYRSQLKTPDQRATGKFRVCVLLSTQPLIAVSNRSYIGKIIQNAGAVNCTGKLTRPYPLLSYEYLLSVNPDIIIIITKKTSDSQAFSEKMRKLFKQLTINKMNSIYTLDPDYICYYTPRDYVLAVGQIADIIKQESAKYEN